MKRLTGLCLLVLTSAALLMSGCAAQRVGDETVMGGIAARLIARGDTTTTNILQACSFHQNEARPEPSMMSQWLGGDVGDVTEIPAAMLAGIGTVGKTVEAGIGGNRQEVADCQTVDFDDRDVVWQRTLDDVGDTGSNMSNGDQSYTSGKRTVTIIATDDDLDLSDVVDVE